MAVKLRLMRMGKKKQPVYRIVAADSRSPRDGRFIEILGTYEPRQEPSRVVVDNGKALRWLKTGAQPTETVARLLTTSGAMEAYRSGAEADGVWSSDPAPAAASEAASSASGSSVASGSSAAS